MKKESSMAIKGVAVLLMIGHHLFRVPELYSGFEISFFPFSESFINKVCSYFKVCVGLFAFISGYGLCNAWNIQRKETLFTERYKSFISARYIRSMGNYWLNFAVLLLICELLDGRTGKVYFSSRYVINNIFELLLSFLGISAITDSAQLFVEWWYISANVLYILMAPLLIESAKKMGIIILLLFFMLPRTIGIEFMGSTHPMSFLMVFMLGVVFCEYDLFKKFDEWRILQYGRLNEKLKVLLVVLVFYVSFLAYEEIPHRKYYDFKYSLSTIAMLGVVRFALEKRVLRETFLFLGKHSTNIWLGHCAFILYAKEWIYRRDHFLLSWLIVLAASVMWSMLIESLKILISYDTFLMCFTKDTTIVKR